MTFPLHPISRKYSMPSETRQADVKDIGTENQNSPSVVQYDYTFATDGESRLSFRISQGPIALTGVAFCEGIEA
jgi:hypothetical protein